MWIGTETCGSTFGAKVSEKSDFPDYPVQTSLWMRTEWRMLALHQRPRHDIADKKPLRAR
jgi:hypothetical protein